MRRIKVDRQLSNEVHQFCSTLFDARDKNFIRPLIKLKQLRDSIKRSKHKEYKLYVQTIIDNYLNILKAEPDEMRDLIKKFERISPKVDVAAQVPHKKIEFYKAVVEAMRYEALREREYLAYLNDKSYKVCVYCNANSTLVVDFTYFDPKRKKKIKKRRARLELDHFHPKSKYPFLCTSFFNLYPVCGSCNRSKSNNPANFELYSKTDLLDSFVFWIDDLSIINYWNSRGKNKSELKVCFKSVDGDQDLLKNHNELFQIQGITDCNLDLAEELVHKALVYNTAYKKMLLTSFISLFPDQTISNRLLIGNYDKPEDIHKRPMAKFTQDIARQLGLI